MVHKTDCDHCGKPIPNEDINSVFNIYRAGDCLKDRDFCKVCTKKLDKFIEEDTW